VKVGDLVRWGGAGTYAGTGIITSVKKTDIMLYVVQWIDNMGKGTYPHYFLEVIGESKENIRR